ncbi:hypothetical protein K5549_003390 [Capra hircus]|nr:hypothetical protein K5549_003390 [Capra hircus]
MVMLRFSPPVSRRQTRQERLTRSIPPGPLLQTSDGKEMEEGTIRYLVQPRGARSGPGPWQGGRRKFRRQRPRLSHKGPMPF